MSAATRDYRRCHKKTRAYESKDAPEDETSPIPGDCAFSLGPSDVSLDSGPSPLCSLQRLGPSGPNVHRVPRGL
jgi:hypothetical protein